MVQAAVIQNRMHQLARVESWEAVLQPDVRLLKGQRLHGRQQPLANVMPITHPLEGLSGLSTIAGFGRGPQKSLLDTIA